jgi:hypothetical protein
MSRDHARESGEKLPAWTLRGSLEAMGNQAHAWLEAALALPKHQRADLTEKLLASVEDEVSNSDMVGEHGSDPEGEKAWAAEITRRAERALRGETVGIPGTEVDAQIRRILKGK